MVGLAARAAPYLTGSKTLLKHKVVNLSTAENALMADFLLEKFMQIEGVASDDICYGDFIGQRQFREKCAHFLGNGVVPEEIVVSNGASSALEILGTLCCDAGDSVIIPTPLYPGFSYAFERRLSLNIIPVDIEDDWGFKADSFITKVERILQTNSRVKAIALSHPNNPIGYCLSEEDFAAVQHLAKRHDIHIFVDQMYVRSHFLGRPPVDALKFIDSNTHIVYGFSKDFCISGFSTGLIISKNKDLLEASKSLARFYRTSNYNQKVISTLLADEEWLSSFFSSLQRRLSAAFFRVEKLLDYQEIPFVKPGAGLSMWLDLRGVMYPGETEEEMEAAFLDQGVWLQGGRHYRSQKPGCFRMCFTRKNVEINTGIEKVAGFMRSRRESL